MAIASLGLVVLVAVAIAAGVYAQQHGTSPGGPRANVVVILADDMQAESLWAMPSLGRLAERGVTFTRSFATTPLCCPSRATLMTGLSARHHGVLTNQPPLGGVERFDDRSTLATWLQVAGVRTGLAGRYLNGYASLVVPPGWDHWYAIWQSGEGYSNYYRYRATDNGQLRYHASAPKDYSTRVINQQALKFLAEDRDRPFLLMLTPRAPHGPATPDPLDSGAYKALDLPLPPSYDEADVSDKPGYVRERSRLNAKERAEVETYRRHQLESLLSVDRMIDTIVETLRADGRLDRTWIIFTADNGLTLGEHRLVDAKTCPYEECIRVPLVVIPPGGLPAGRVDDRLLANLDLAPTIAAAMDVEPGAAVDGQSLIPLLADPGAPWRDALVFESWGDDPEPLFVAVRTADRKYVRYRQGEEELYDLAADPYELENLADDAGWAAEKARLGERLDVLLAEPGGAPAAARR